MNVLTIDRLNLIEKKLDFLTANVQDDGFNFILQDIQADLKTSLAELAQDFAGANKEAK